MSMTMTSDTGLTSNTLDTAAEKEAAADTSGLFHQVPFNRLLDIRREFAENGVARISMVARPDLTNKFGNAHGGVIATMIDVAMSNAAMSRTGFTMAVVTIDMSTSFIKSGRGRLTAHAQATGGGRSICFCEARIEDESGELVAKGMGSFKYIQDK